MKNFSRFGLKTIVLAFIFSAFAATETNAQSNTEILKRMDNRYKSLQTLQAGVIMGKYNAQLDETDVFTGNVWYIPANGKQKMALRLNWTTPVVEYLAVVNGLYRLYRPRLKQAYDGTVNKAKGSPTVAGPLSFLSMSKAELSKNFSVKNLGEEDLSDGRSTLHLELTPKTAQKYKLAELWVDKDGMPLQAKIVEKNNDTTTVLLTDLRENVEIDTDIFVIELPSGVKSIKQ